MSNLIIGPNNTLTVQEESRRQARSDASGPRRNDNNNNPEPTRQDNTETPTRRRSRSFTQENTDSSQQQELINSKFAKSLESIGDILKGSVEAQKKAFKNDLDKVDKTYKAFVKTSSEQSSILNKSSDAQKEVFKGLTDQFVKFREDEKGDAKKFHDDLLASLQALYAAGGDEESTKAMDAIIRNAIKSTKIDPNMEKYSKKWELSKEEKNSWSYKLFGYKEPTSEISPEDIARKSGEAEAISKNLFGNGKGEKPEKTPTEKMLEAILRNTERKNNNRTEPNKERTIDKLTISNLIVEKIGGKVGEMFERIANQKRLRGPKEKIKIKDNSPTYDELRKSVSDIEDVDYKDIPAVRKIHVPNLLEYDAPIVEESKKEKKVKQSNPQNKLKTVETPMTKAIKSAMSDIKPSIPQAATLPMVVEAGKILSNDSADITPNVKVEPVPDAPEAESSPLEDAASILPSLIPNKFMKKAGRFLGKAGKFLGKGLAGVTVGLAADSAADYLGRDTKAGASADIVGSMTTMAGAGAMLGSVVPGIGTAIGAGLGGIAGAGYGAYKNWSTLSKDDAKKYDSDLNKMANDAVAEKAAAIVPVVIGSPSSQSTPSISQSTNFMAVTARARDRDNYFDQSMSKSFTAK